MLQIPYKATLMFENTNTTHILQSRGQTRPHYFKSVKRAANEINQFVGNATLTGKRLNFRYHHRWQTFVANA